MIFEYAFSFLEADRIDDAFALNAFEAGFNHLPSGAVEHDRNARDIRFGGNDIQESRHRGFRIEHALIHVDVDDLSSVFDLVARDGNGLFVLAGEDQL